MNVYFVTAIILLFYFVLAWAAGALLRLHGASLWILRGGLMLIGAVAAGLFLWFHHRLRRRASIPPEQWVALSEQVRILLRQAEQRLKSGNQGSLSSLPIVFVLGELNSAKTSVVLHSGLEPELIAGHVLRDNEIVPTTAINIWFARKTIFIEAGGKLSQSAQLWGLILRLTRPGRLFAAMGKSQTAPRATLVCLDCERLASSQTAVQTLSGRLKEMARSLGAAFPVYVLFTKLDRIPHFADFVANLSHEESGQILGSTLPRVTSYGVFAEEESKRLARAFDQIVFSLAEKRLDYLKRETVAQEIGGIYEFPRELRKSRNQLVQLLVDLTRPTQLSANPFLRGFYFSGVRAVIINEAVSVPAMTRTASVSGGGATRMFNLQEAAAISAQSAPRRSVQSRKVPEWAFLPHLFAEVILADRAGFSASNQSTRVQRLRRGLLASASLLSLLFAVAVLGSFIKNRALEINIREEAEHLSSISKGMVIESPSIEQLRGLEALRSALEKLTQYQMQGPPLSHRFGLFIGDRIYDDARSMYFQNFRRLLLAATQARMVSILAQLPGTRTTDDFQRMYSTLKAYLITTSNHEHADWNLFVPVLLDNSPAFKGADSESQNLIHRQFSFYGETLLAINPYRQDKDGAAVGQAQNYLKDFQVEAIYQAMLEDAGKGNKPVNFNRRFPQAAGYVVDSYEVPAAFTKEGYAIMQKSLQNPEKFKGEEWVLGTTPMVNLPAGSLRDALTNRYAADYLKHWRAYLRSARVVGYSNLQDASVKLSKLVANDSPLLELLWLAKENTAIDIPDLKNPFDAVQRIARDSSLERLVGSGNQEYMNALSTLQGNVQNVVNTPNGPRDPGMLSQILQSASGASVTVKGIERNFTIDTLMAADKADKVDKNVGRLLEEPIDYANDAAKRAMGGGAEDVCKMVNSVTSKRPFNLRSNQQASFEEVQDLFRPQGTLWTSLPAKVSTVQHQGSTWVNVGSAPQSQKFIAFLNHAQQFTDTLFPAGSSSVRLGYTLRALPSAGVEHTSLTVDGQTIGDSGRQYELIWQGADGSITLTATIGGQQVPLHTYQGPWALFDFFTDGDWIAGNNPATVAWPFRSQVQFAHEPARESSTTTVKYELTTHGPAQVFRKEFLTNFHCSSQ